MNLSSGIVIPLFLTYNRTIEELKLADQINDIKSNLLIIVP